jgi:hypothetical protein
MCFRKMAGIAAVVAVMGLCMTRVGAETLRPLVTEDANVLPQGQVDLKLSIEYIHNYVPEFSNGHDHGDLYELPRMGANIGVSNNVEVQMDWAVLKIHSDLHDEYGPGDPRIFTKINVFKEDGNMPAMGVRFGIKIPSADDKKGLGDNRFDFYAQGLISKGFGSVTAHANLGFALLDNTSTNFGQDDLFTYGFAVVVPVIDKFDIAGEVVGQLGSKTNNDKILARIGVRYTIEDITLDGSIAAGLDKDTEDYRVGAGLTYHWKAF